MDLWLKIIFWGCIYGVAHTYLIFPLFMALLSTFFKKNEVVYEMDPDQTNELPFVDILLAVYNEETVIEEKLRTTFETNYPLEKIRFFIGSDNSSDRTNELIEDFQKQHGDKFQIEFIPFTERTGKAGIVNALSDRSSAPVLIFTDANVFFDESTIFELVKHYKNPDIGVVSANIINVEYKKEGISFQERRYLELEKKLKHDEGKVWGTMIGAFGGCYSIRKSCFVKVPNRFLMDDFYISMNVFKQKKRALLSLEAKCYEDVSDKMSEEFRRKIRISAGNFQNLFAYLTLLKNPFSAISYTFWSHKILRWFTPFLLITALATSLILAWSNPIYYVIILATLSLILIIFAEILLSKININIKLIRFLTHFASMNLALMIGFFKFLTGVQTNIWKPTERYQ